MTVENAGVTVSPSLLYLDSSGWLGFGTTQKLYLNVLISIAKMELTKPLRIVAFPPKTIKPTYIILCPSLGYWHSFTKNDCRLL